MNRTRFVLWTCAVGLLGTAALAARAQEFPKKPISLIVGFAAGGATDAAARIIAKKLQDNLGQPVVVENRAGAGGNIAHQYVAGAPADGSVILLGSIGPLTIAPHLMKVGYDAQRDLAPLTMGVLFPNVLVVHVDTGIKSLADYIAQAKAKPKTIYFASTGPGSASHLAGELLNQQAGMETVHVPYKGGAPAMQDLLGGRVTSYYSTPATATPHIKAGKLVPLATTGVARTAFMPDVPTVAESGFPGFNATNWYAFVAPGKTPATILDRWNAELVKALNSPDVKADLDGHGLTPAPGTREELAKFIEKESATWAQLIKERKIQAE